jgi:phosphoribosylglycinamide formyltransferase-1
MVERIPRVGILASGNGTTAAEFIRATQEDGVPAEVALVVCNKPQDHPEAGIYQKVDDLNRRHGLSIETVHISGQTHPRGNVGRGQTLQESRAIRDLMHERDIDHVALMGYMRIVRGALLGTFGHLHPEDSIYRARMSNTHPGPLPETADTYGLGASQRVLDLGLLQSAHTVHLVSAGVDAGPVIAAHPVDVLADDTAETLFARVQKEEKARLPGVLGEFLMEQLAYYKGEQ